MKKFKVIFIVFLYVVVQWIKDMISPLLLNKSAMIQLSDSIDSHIYIQQFNKINVLTNVILFAILILLFNKEIKNIILKIKERKNESK